MDVKLKLSIQCAVPEDNVKIPAVWLIGEGSSWNSKQERSSGKLVYGEHALPVSCACASVTVGRGGTRDSGKLAW